jgi:zinc protease
MVILARPNFYSPSVVINGYLMAGSLNDSDEKLGLADFTAIALMRGTINRDFQQIFNTLESVGANLGFEGGLHTTGFWGRSLVEDLDMLLELLSEAVRQPTFPPEHIERLRAQLLTGLSIRAQNTGELASMAFDELVYANHPYRRPEDGYPETVERITREDLVAFHNQYYGPRGLTIAIVGAVDPQQVVEKVTNIFEGWQNPAQPQPSDLPPLAPLNMVQRKEIEIPGKFQADILLGATGPSRQSPDFMAANLGNSILGQFGMMGRVGAIVREKAGLAYYAHSSLGGGKGPGPWTMVAGVAPQNIERAISLMLQELTRFVKEPVSQEELADNQANFIGRLPLSLESNGGVASALINLERFELGLDYYQRYPGEVKAITPEKILQVASRYLDPERIAIALAGPKNSREDSGG